MDNNQGYYVTYKFYDERGRRVTIFCIPGYGMVEEGRTLPATYDKLFIYVLPCSNKDTFSKAAAKNLFEQYITYKKMGFDCAIAHPIEFQVDVHEGKPKFTFLKWCEENYFKFHRTVLAVEAMMLWRGDEQHKKAQMFDTQFVPIQDMDSIPQTTSLS